MVIFKRYSVNENVPFGNIVKYCQNKYGKLDKTLCFIPIESYIGNGDQLVQDKITINSSKVNIAGKILNIPGIVKFFLEKKYNPENFKRMFGEDVKNVIIGVNTGNGTAETCTEIDTGDGGIILLLY